MTFHMDKTVSPFPVLNEGMINAATEVVEMKLWQYDIGPSLCAEIAEDALKAAFDTLSKEQKAKS